MSEHNDGGAAFPCPGGGGFHREIGMSLRDWFAGQALTGIIANPHEPNGETWGEIITNLSRSAYQYADAMLAERAKRMPSADLTDLPFGGAK